MKDYIDIAVGLTALIAVIRARVSILVAAIYDAIEDLKESVNNRINCLEHSFAVHVAIYALRKEQVDYLRKRRVTKKSTRKLTNFLMRLKNLNCN
jgi:cation transport regulator ChaB